MAEPYRDAIWEGDSGRPKELCVRWESRSPSGRGNFWALSDPLKSTVNHCCAVHSKKSITASANCITPDWLVSRSLSPPPAKNLPPAMRPIVKVLWRLVVIITLSVCCWWQRWNVCAVTCGVTERKHSRVSCVRRSSRCVLSWSDISSFTLVSNRSTVRTAPTAAPLSRIYENTAMPYTRFCIRRKNATSHEVTTSPLLDIHTRAVPLYRGVPCRRAVPLALLRGVQPLMILHCCQSTRC